MKKLYTILAPLCIAVLSFTSCLSDEKTETSPECAIYAFSVGDIKSSVVTKNANGNDTTITKTISGSDIIFNIDQLNGRIYSIDSLPNWTDLSGVVPKFSAYGYVYGQVNLSENDSSYYYITSGSDSLDLTKTFELYVVSSDGLSTKKYKLDLYKKLENSDTLEWKKYDANIEYGEVNHYVSTSKNVFMFYEKDGETYTSRTSTGTNWTTTAKVEGIKFNSVVTIQDKLFALGKDSKIYYSLDGEGWMLASSITVDRILAIDNQNIYALKDEKIIGAFQAEMENWDVYGESDINMLPTSFISSHVIASKTNKNIENVVMVGLSDKNTSNSVAWFKITSKDKSSDQRWTYTNSSYLNLYNFPYLEELSATAYDNAIFAVGKNKGSYDNIYRSDDNGISWHPLDSKYPLPEDINNGEKANASIVTIGNELWIIKGKNIWKGKMQ